MDIAALVISIISLLVGTGLTIYEIYQSKKEIEVSLEAGYFDELYKKILIKDVPCSRSKITFNAQGYLTGTAELIDVLQRIRQNSMYFLYADEEFYTELKKELTDLEDYLIKTEEKPFSGEEQRIVFNTIHSYISKIYKIMTTKYKGK